MHWLNDDFFELVVAPLKKYQKPIVFNFFSRCGKSDAIKPFAGFEPRVGEILADVRYEIGPVGSRLPLRG